VKRSQIEFVLARTTTFRCWLRVRETCNGCGIVLLVHKSTHPAKLAVEVDPGVVAPTTISGI
jgi:hypothetical protein